MGSLLAGALNPLGAAVVQDGNHAPGTVFVLREVSALEIVDAINTMKGRSAPGWDGIQIDLIKNNIEYLLCPIHHPDQLLLFW